MIGSTQILVASADEDVTRAMTRAVIELGYSVSAVATTGEEAVIAAAETPTILSLVDVQLPGDLDGVGVGKVLERTLRIPFIYVTEDSDAEAFRRARNTRPHGYILKPVSRPRLRSAIQLALQRASLEDEVPAAVGEARPPAPRLAAAEVGGPPGGNGNGGNGVRRLNGGSRHQERDSRDRNARDPLTLLEDGEALVERAGMAIENLDETGSVALVLVDLVRFSEVNQELGRRAGDEILEQVARRLQLRIQPGDVVAKLSEDRFGVLFTRVPGFDAALRSAGLLLDAFGPAFHASHWPVRLEARVALAVCPDHARDARELMEAARMALESVRSRQESVLQVCESATV